MSLAVQNLLQLDQAPIEHGAGFSRSPPCTREDAHLQLLVLLELWGFVGSLSLREMQVGVVALILSSKSVSASGSA
jgi:hypothetical protein